MAKKERYEDKYKREKFTIKEEELSHGQNLKFDSFSVVEEERVLFRGLFLDGINDQKVLKNREVLQNFGILFSCPLKQEYLKNFLLDLTNFNEYYKNILISEWQEEFEKINKKGLLVGKAYEGRCREYRKFMYFQDQISEAKESFGSRDFYDSFNLGRRFFEIKEKHEPYLFPKKIKTVSECLLHSPSDFLPTIEKFPMFSKLNFRLKTLVTIAAESGIGKSVLLLNIAAEYIRLKQKVVFFSVEMDRDTILKLFVCLLFNIEPFHVFTKEEAIRYENQFLKYFAPYLQIVEATGYCFNDFLREATYQFEDTQIIFVDYIQRFRSKSKFSEKYAEEEDNLKAANDLAVTHNKIIFNAAQIQKAKRGKEGEKKGQSDLSGSVEVSNSSSLVLTLEPKANSKLELTIVKMRYAVKNISKETFHVLFKQKEFCLEEEPEISNNNLVSNI